MKRTAASTTCSPGCAVPGVGRSGATAEARAVAIGARR